MRPPERLPPDDPREWMNRARANLALAKNRVPYAYLDDLCFEARLTAETGASLLTPNKRHVAEDGRDCYWLYVVTNCAAQPKLQEPTRDPARFPWHEVSKLAHYYLSVDALTQPMRVRERQVPYQRHED